MNFQEALETGKAGESLIARYFLEHGYSVLPIYKTSPCETKGPVLYSAMSGPLIAPDMLVFKGQQVLWIEAKLKTAFVWYRKAEKWITGINTHHYQQYLTIQEERPDWPIWLLFLQQNGIAKDTPEGKASPTGLFGNALDYLSQHVTVEYPRSEHGRGMVCWEIDALKLLAPLADLTS